LSAAPQWRTHGPQSLKLKPRARMSSAGVRASSGLTPMIRDRAALIATAIQQITNRGALSEAERHEQIAALLREELADIQREVADHRAVGDV
jgi:hypothetical protein